MALRPLVRDIGLRASLSSIPNVRFSTAAGEGLATISGALTSAAQVQKRREDEDDAIRGAQEGAEAALKKNIQIDGRPIPSFERVSGSGAFEKAFNRSQLTVYKTRLEDTTRRQAALLALQHRNDPVAMSEAMAGFVNGIAQTVPATLRADFLKQSQNFIRPHVMDAWNRVHKAKEEDVAASLNALTTSQFRDAHTFGMQIGSGSTAAMDGAVALGDIFKSFVDKVANSVDGIDYTVNEGLEDIQVFSSTLAKNTLMGMFDGTTEKNAMFAKFLKGDLVVELPITDADGNVSIEKQNIANILGNEDASDLRTYMKSRIDGLYAQRARSRAEAEDAADFSNRRALSRLARNGDRDAYREVLGNPNSTVADVETAQRLIRDVPHQSQPDYFSAVRNGILLGSITDQSELDFTQLSQADRDELLGLIEEQTSAAHFTKNVQYQTAEDTLKTRILEQVNTQVQFQLVTPRAASGTRQALAARFILSLKKLAQGTVDGGGIVGRNSGGNVFEEIDAPNAPDGKLLRFDPVAWVDDTIAIYERRVKGITEQLAPLRQQARDIGTELFNAEPRSTIQQNLTTRLERVQKQIRALKLQMTTLELEEILEGLD